MYQPLILLAEPNAIIKNARSSQISSDSKDIATRRFTIKSVKVDDFVQPSSDGARAFFQEKLAQEGTKSAEEIVDSYFHPRFLSHMTSLFGTSSRQKIQNHIPSSMFLEGELSIPTALPPNVRGLDASKRNGNLAMAHVVLKALDGRPFLENDAAISWDDVHWISGGKSRQTRSIDEVLIDAAQGVIKKATRGLFERLKNDG
jgi:hypothetical protein